MFRDLKKLVFLEFKHFFLAIFLYDYSGIIYKPQNYQCQKKILSAFLWFRGKENKAVRTNFKYLLNFYYVRDCVSVLYAMDEEDSALIPHIQLARDTQILGWLYYNLKHRMKCYVQIRKHWKGRGEGPRKKIW